MKRSDEKKERGKGKKIRFSCLSLWATVFRLLMHYFHLAPNPIPSYSIITHYPKYLNYYI